MSVPSQNTNGYLKLFDFDGREVPASREELLSIEGMSFDEDLHRKVVGNRSGRYWLISDRPGFHAMLLQVVIFHCYPREEDEWSISYCTNGVASYQHFDLESAIRLFSEARNSWDLDPNDYKPLPANVAKIARQRVSYRLGKTPGEDPLDRFGVRTRDAVEMRQLLDEFTERSVDPTGLLRSLAGKRVSVVEILFAITFFCGENGLDGKEDELLAIIVAKNQHERLTELLETLSNQLGPETE